MKYFRILISIIIFTSCASNVKEKHRMEKTELNNGQSIYSKELSNAEYNRLISDSACKLISKYKIDFGIDVYVNQKKEVIVNENGYYTFYNKIEDLEQLLNNHNPEQQGAEVLLNLNPYGKNFPSLANELITALSDSLKISSKDFNGSIDFNYINSVEYEISRLSQPNQFYKQNFIKIIALIYSSLIKEYGATWNMQLGDDGITWNPYIKIRNESLEIFTNLYEDVFLNDNTKNAITESYLVASGIIKHNIK